MLLFWWPVLVTLHGWWLLLAMAGESAKWLVTTEHVPITKPFLCLCSKEIETGWKQGGISYGQG